MKSVNEIKDELKKIADNLNSITDLPQIPYESLSLSQGLSCIKAIDPTCEISIDIRLEENEVRYKAYVDNLDASVEANTLGGLLAKIRDYYAKPTTPEVLQTQLATIEAPVF